MADAPYQPLAARMRPARLAEYAGQQHILAPGKPLREAIEAGHLHSMILWGPPGVGKTTLARLMAAASDARFIAISAVLSGVKEIRASIDEAQQHKQLGEKTVLFVDEVHRFNKAQQDAFLPYVEDGTLIFIGATTETRPSSSTTPCSRAPASTCCAAWRRTTCCNCCSSAERCRARPRRAEAEGRRGLAAPHCPRCRRRCAPRPEHPRDRRRSCRARRDQRSRGDGKPARQRAPLRQAGRIFLRPDLRAAQSRTWFQRRRRALLAGAHARRRCRSALRRPARRAHGERGHR